MQGYETQTLKGDKMFQDKLTLTPRDFINAGIYRYSEIVRRLRVKYGSKAITMERKYNKKTGHWRGVYTFNPSK